MVEKDASSSDHLEPVVDAEKNLANALAETERISTQHQVDKDLLDGVHMALTFYKTASKQRIIADAKDCEQFLLIRRLSTPNCTSSETIFMSRLIQVWHLWTTA